MSLIDLDRRFRKLAAGPVEDEPSYLLSERSTLGWPDLLEHPRVVILGSARAGKTSELQLQAGSVKSDGKSAFLIRLNDLSGSTLAIACMRDGPDLDSWLKGTAPGWFFLDARDELAVTGKQLYNALANLSSGLGSTAARARILITSRPTDWKSLSDLQDFKQLLPAPGVDIDVNDRRAAPVPLDEAEDFDEVDTPENTRAADNFLVAQMVPLDESRVLKLAAHFGVTDTDKFKTALRRQDATSLAGNPGDLKGIVTLWREHGAFRNYEEIIRSTIKTSLEELRTLPDAKAELSVEQYNTGGRRLSATMVLARGTAFRVEDEDTAEQPKSVIRPDDAFTDWQPSQLDAVLRTNLFEPRSFGLVHFQNRTVKEYLAAQWAIQIQNKFGLAKSDLRRLFFVDIYGESILIPSMGPVVAWMAVRDERIRSELLVRSAETLLEYGDPEQLTLVTKAEVLEGLVTSVLKKGSRVYARDSRMLRALATRDLTDLIRNLWVSASKKSSSREPRHREDALILLLKLTQLGEIKALAPIVSKYASKKSSSWLGVIFAVRAMISLGATNDIKKFVSNLLSMAATLERRLVLGVIQELYPKHLTAAQTMGLIDLHQNGERSFDIEPEHTISAVIDRADTSTQRIRLLNDLAARWFTSGPVADDEAPTQREKSAKQWIVPAILKLTAKIFKEDNSVVFSEDQIVAIAGSVKYSEDYIRKRESVQVHGALLSHVGREKAFWTLLKRFEEWYPFPRLSAETVARVNLLFYWMGFRELDLAWMLSDTSKPSMEAAIWAALRVWLAEGKSDAILQRIRIAAGDDPKLLLLISQATDTSDSEELREFREQSRRMAQERDAQKRQIEESWAEFREELRANPGQLTDVSPENANTRFNALRNLYAWLTQPQRTKGRRNIYAVSNIEDLAAEYGAEVVKAATEGFKSFWRSYTSKLPSALKGIERNQTPYATIISLTGLAVEAAEGDVWIKALSAGEVRLAVRHAFRELNGFPSWLSALAAEHQVAVNAMIEAEIVSELAESDQDAHPSVLSRLPRQDLDRWPGLVETITNALRTKQATNDRAFEYAIDILLEGGHSRKDDCESLYRERISVDSETEAHKIGYLAAWFALNADAATDALFALIQAKSPEDKDRIVAEVFAQLSGEIRRGPIRFSAKDSVRTLERLVEVAYQHIRYDEDIRHEGVYSPGKRDRAESGRDYVVKLLSEIPGSLTHDALVRLAEKPHLRSISEGLRRAAFNRALEDSESPWKPAEVLQFEQEAAKEPQNAGELFQVVLRRLNEIREDLEDGDFSQSALLKLSKKREEHYQIWLAGQLDLRSRGLYSVTRESEAKARKRPDVVVQRTRVEARIPIEVKIADTWSGRQLRNAYKKQLIGQYQRDRRASHGVLLLIGLSKSKFWRLGKKRVRGVEELAKFLKASGIKDVRAAVREFTTDIVIFRIWK